MHHTVTSYTLKPYITLKYKPTNDLTINFRGRYENSHSRNDNLSDSYIKRFDFWGSYKIKKYTIVLSYMYKKVTLFYTIIEKVITFTMTVYHIQ